MEVFSNKSRAHMHHSLSSFLEVVDCLLSDLLPIVQLAIDWSDEFHSSLLSHELQCWTNLVNPFGTDTESQPPEFE